MVLLLGNESCSKLNLHQSEYKVVSGLNKAWMQQRGQKSPLTRSVANRRPGSLTTSVMMHSGNQLCLDLSEANTCSRCRGETPRQRLLLAALTEVSAPVRTHHLPRDTEQRPRPQGRVAGGQHTSGFTCNKIMSNHPIHFFFSSICLWSDSKLKLFLSFVGQKHTSYIIASIIVTFKPFNKKRVKFYFAFAVIVLIFLPVYLN